MHAHDLEVEAAFAAAAGLEPAGRPCGRWTPTTRCRALLEREGVVAATRAGRLRVSFHVHNTVAEAERLGALLRGHVSG